MTVKTAVILLLVSIFSVYFLCPVLCPALQAENCSVSTADQAGSHRLDFALPTSETHSSGSTCCPTENKGAAPDESPEKSDDNCCLDRLELLKASEVNSSSPTPDKLPSFNTLIPARSAIPTLSTSFVPHFQLSPHSSLDPPHYQISPRAPPFFLA